MTRDDTLAFVMLRKLIGKPGQERREPSEGERGAPFVVGVSRSGTTLLRLMLDAHPELAIPPETHFVPKAIKVCAKADDPRRTFLDIVTSSARWHDHHIDEDLLREKLDGMEPFDVGEALRAFYETYAERVSKRRWGDKTPMYVRHMKAISRALPEARFVHLIRDGRDVALSATKAKMGPGTVQAWAERWRSQIEQARAARGALEGKYTEVRYEDLVSDPETVLKRVCAFVSLSWAPVMLEYHRRAPERIRELNNDLPGRGERPGRRGEERVAMHALTGSPPRVDRIGAWKTEMTAEEVGRFEEVAGETLVRLGYERAGREP